MINPTREEIKPDNNDLQQPHHFSLLVIILNLSSSSSRRDPAPLVKVCESMAEMTSSHHPIITFRPIRPSDLEVLEELHRDLFPIGYEPEFFHNVVNGNDIVSWGVVDHSRPNYLGDQLIGFVTAKIFLAKESEISDLIRCDSSSVDQTLVYILTLGVVGSYRKLGIASALIKEVIKYASSIPTCRAVYLHVISYNAPAIHLYRKMSFTCVRCLYGFYLISGQQYDSYLFVYYVNGGKSPCSPLRKEPSWMEHPRVTLFLQHFSLGACNVDVHLFEKCGKDSDR
ncbi:Histone acetyltransferase MCC1-like protein [Drosera capensis]